MGRKYRRSGSDAEATQFRNVTGLLPWNLRSELIRDHSRMAEFRVVKWGGDAEAVRSRMQQDSGKVGGLDPSAMGEFRIME